MTPSAETISNPKRSIDILLAEDNEADIKIALRAFDKARIKNNIFVVRHGEEALNYVQNQRQYADSSVFKYPDMILLDIQMPKLTGFDVLKVLKKDEKFKAIPVVMLTSSKSDEDIVKSYRYGAVSFIQKPINYEEFEKVVEVFNLYWHNINKLPNLKKSTPPDRRLSTYPDRLLRVMTLLWH